MKTPLAPIDPTTYGVALHRSYKHLKSGEFYVPVALARLESAPEIVLVVYVGPNEAVWARPVDEFCTRFQCVLDVL